MRLLAVVQKGGAFLADATEPADTNNAAGADATDPGASAADAEYFASKDEVDAADDIGHGRTGTCSVYSTPDGTSVPFSQAEHYAHRDAALGIMNFDEFVMSTHIAKKPAEQHHGHDGPGDRRIRATPSWTRTRSRNVTTSSKNQSSTCPCSWAPRRHACPPS